MFLSTIGLSAQTSDSKLAGQQWVFCGAEGWRDSSGRMMNNGDWKGHFLKFYQDSSVTLCNGNDRESAFRITTYYGTYSIHSDTLLLIFNSSQTISGSTGFVVDTSRDISLSGKKPDPPVWPKVARLKIEKIDGSIISVVPLSPLPFKYRNPFYQIDPHNGLIKENLAEPERVMYCITN